MKNIKLRLLLVSIIFLNLSSLVCAQKAANAYVQTTAGAQEPGILPPLPEKLPASVEARVGRVDLKRGMPTEKGIKQLFEIQDFQRATQLYQWAIPAIGLMGLQRAGIANGGTGALDWVMYDDFIPRAGILTPNTEVAYVATVPDLQATGPLVLEYPAERITGMVLDFWQRPLFDFGLTGPERGRTGGKVLVLGPGQKEPADTAGFHVVRVPTRFALIAYRIINRSEKDRVSKLIKLYPYSQRNNPPAPKVIEATKDFMQSQPRGMAYWEAVNELIQREPVHERDRFFYAMLASLGIEKGKPFAPDEQHKKLLEDAALLGEHISRALTFEKRGVPDNYYRPDARWIFPLVVEPGQRRENYDHLDPRTIWFYEALSASYAMISDTPGVGQGFLGTYRDKDGGWLDGGNSYRLRISPNPPMKQFWAVTVYDLDTRALIRNKAMKPEISSNTPALQKNADGSVDLYFGPTAPAGKESNWIQTTKGEFWFVYFRLYAPTEPFFDRSWPLADIEKSR